MAVPPVGSRERALMAEGLAPFFSALCGRVINVMLRNEHQARGTLTSFDCFMNVTLKNATMCAPYGPIGHLPLVFLQKKFIRGIRLDDNTNLDLSSLMKDHHEILSGAKAKKKRKKARAKYILKKEQRKKEFEQGSVRKSTPGFSSSVRPSSSRPMMSSTEIRPSKKKTSTK